MRKIFFKLLLVLLIAVCVLPATVFARNFLRNLKMGDAGEDVLFVQKTLNLYPATQIALTGIGSPGNENGYFGAMTRNAIIKFQKLYANDVLKPAGLSSPTGVVGPLTQKKINDVSLSISVSTSTSVYEQRYKLQAEDSKTTDLPVIDSVSPNIIDGNITLKIKGKHFGIDNTILISVEDDNKYKGVKSIDANNIELPVSLTVINAMSKMNNLDSTSRSSLIAEMIKEGQFVAGPGDGSAYLDADLVVQNKNGKSNSVKILVKVINK